MAIEIDFIDRDRNALFTLSIPEGLKDESALKEFINSCGLSRQGRRSAWSVARRKYKAYNRDWWDENEGKWEGAEEL